MKLKAHAPSSAMRFAVVLMAAFLLASSLFVGLGAIPAFTESVAAAESGGISVGASTTGMTNPPKGDASRTLTIARPSVANGDLLLAQITFEKGRDAGSDAQITPEGWTLIRRTNGQRHPNGTDLGQAIFYRVVADVAVEPTSYGFPFRQAVKAGGAITPFVGVNSAHPQGPIVASSGASGSSKTLTAPGVAAADNDLVVGFFGFKKKNSTLGVPSGMTGLYNFGNPQDVTLAAARELGLTADGVAKTSTPSPNNSDKWVAQLVALREPAVEFELTVLHNNDGESKLRPAFVSLPGPPPPAPQIPDPNKPYAGVARFATLVDILKDEAINAPVDHPGAKRGSVMLSSGDNFLAGAEFAASLDKGVPFYDSIAMSLIGYDAIAIGNHEFDFGPETLADFIRGFDPAVPFLSSNLDVSGEPTLAALEDQGRIAKSTIVDENGELVGVIGATTPQLPNISSPRNVLVGEVAPAINAEVTALQALGVNKIILVSHLQNVNEELALAPMLSGVDVMIAGGGDELLVNPWNPLSPADTPALIRGPYPHRPGGLPVLDRDGKEVQVITTAGDYKYVGRLEVGFDSAGNVVDVDEQGSGPVRVIGFDDGTVTSGANTTTGIFSGPAQVRAATNYIVGPDPEVQEQVVEPINEFVADLVSNILATSEVPLDGQNNFIRTRETNLGNLAADSLLWQAQQSAAGFGVDAPQIALQNSGGVRNNSLIPAGNISEFNTFQIFAFTNFVSIMEDVTAEHLLELLETSVSAAPGVNGRFGQWAGLSFTYDVTQPARAINGTTCAVTAPGDRVQSISVAGTPIYADGAWLVDPNTWTVDMTTNDFTFRGGDCYQFHGLPFTTVGVVYQQALANYLTAASGLNGTITAARYPVTPPAAAQRIILLP
jgi:2',3'-cyclic-nucleotide 2'-phosphodiesterase (5'-nucleotidase family)